VSLREKLNQNQGLIIGVVCGLIVLTIFLAFLILRTPGGTANGPRYHPDKDFFSDDDGHSWFIDDAKNIPPFDHGGRQANRAALFIDSNDRKFVGFLESYDPAVKAKMEQELKSGRSLGEVVQENPPKVKKALGGSWATNPRSPEYSRALTVIGPDKKPPKTGRLVVTDADLSGGQ
jgi:hypothetical protein